MTRNRWLAFGGCLFFLTLLVVFINWSGRPVITGGPSDQGAVEGVKTVNQTKILTSEYFTTTIPGELAVKSQNNEQHGNTLSQMFLVNGETNINKPLTDQLAITVGKMNSEGISGLTDVQLRIRNPNKYTPVESTGFPEGSVAFVSTESGYEKSVFWPHNGLYAAVVVSGTSDRITDLDKDLDMVIATWKWQDQ